MDSREISSPDGRALLFFFVQQGLDMKILVAPGAFKGFKNASSIAKIITNALKGVFTDLTVESVPMADGGEGFVQVLVECTNGTVIEQNVLNPLGDEISARWGILGDGQTAVIEMAAASGLSTVPYHKLNPSTATSYGTGQLIIAALEMGCNRIILGLGDSATMDGGIGMAQALGVSFLDSQGRELGFGGGELLKLARIDTKKLNEKLKEVDFIGACDVDNYLYGSSGQAMMYGMQKGATAEVASNLEKGLIRFGCKIEEKYSIDIKNLEGGACAGGMAVSVVSFLKGKLVNGTELVAKYSGLEDALKTADIVITGEGKIDRQTLHGKVPYYVAQLAKKNNIPVIAICGIIDIDPNILHKHGIDILVDTIDKPTTINDAIAQGEPAIFRGAEMVARLIRIGMQIPQS